MNFMMNHNTPGQGGAISAPGALVHGENGTGPADGTPTLDPGCFPTRTSALERSWCIKNEQTNAKYYNTRTSLLLPLRFLLGPASLGWVAAPARLLPLLAPLAPCDAPPVVSRR